MKIEYYEEMLEEEMLEEEAINKYLNMIANDYNGELARIFEEKYINKDKEIERLNNIIKEVREYIEENQEEHKYTDRGGFTYTEGHFLRDSDTLLEILDKGE